VRWGSGQVFLSLLWFFLFIIWIWLFIAVVGDIFRSHDMGGVAKALWVVGIVVFPVLGVVVYLIARGGKMHEHALKDARAQDAAMQSYIRNVAASPSSPAEEISRLADLKAQGVIDDAEFQQLKAKAMGA
jgi:hypothetical protein